MRGPSGFSFLYYSRKPRLAKKVCLGWDLPGKQKMGES